MLFAFRIPMIDEGHILQAINTSGLPSYSSHVSPAIRHTIRCIHGIDKLMKNTPVDDLEVYVGRASNISRTLKRWQEHKQNRGHDWAAVLFRASRDHSKTLEKAAIRVIQQLKNRNALCVGNANISGGANGPNTDVDREIIYMTWGWRTGWETFENKPSTNDIREISHEVARSMGGLVTVQQLQNGLSATKAPLTQYERLEWYDPE